MNWYFKVLNQYAVFQGRARRKEYWMFTLINTLVVMAISIIEAILSTGGIIYLLYSLATLVPMFALGARRLHDTSRTGWWLLLGLIPLLGWIVLFVFLIQDSKDGDNEYGSNPKFAH